MDQKYIVAIEIGSSKIKGVVGVLEADRPLAVVASEEVRFDTDDLLDSVRYGLIQNVDKVATIVKQIITRLQRSPQISPRVINAVYVGLGARSMYAVEVEVERDYAEEVEITQQYVSQLSQNARTAHNLSDKEVIAVTPLSFIVDGSKTNNPVGMYASKIKAKFMVVTIKQSAVKNIRRVICDRLGLQIAGITVRPLAEGAAVLTDDERRLGCMLVDFGAETVTTTIYKSGVMRYMSTLPMGSRNITRDLMTLNFTEERANALKRTIGNVEVGNVAANRNVEGVNSTEVNEIISARAQEIAANIIEQISYAGMTPEEIGDGIVLVGGGSRLAGFPALLKSQSEMNVRLGTFFGNVRIVDSRLQPDNSVDILSILLQESKGDPMSCASNPAPQQQGDLFDDASADDAEQMFDDDNDESDSRLGGDIDPSLRGRKNPKKPKNKKPKEPKVKKPVDRPEPASFVDDEEDEEDGNENNDNSTKTNLWRNISERFTRLLDEETE